MKLMKKWLIVLLAVVSCKQNKRTLPYYNTADFTPQWELPDDRKKNHFIRPFSLTDQDGNTVTEKTMNGKICVVDFFFTTCPGICPKLTHSMSDIQREFKADSNVMLLSHTATPETDSVPTLKKYALQKGVVSGKWHLLTGKRSELYDLGRNYYFIEEDLGLKRDTSVFLHTENFVLVDRKRRLRGIYNGLDKLSMEQLAIDIKLLEEESD
jgi:protein SCO1/2